MTAAERVFWLLFVTLALWALASWYLLAEARRLLRWTNEWREHWKGRALRAEGKLMRLCEAEADDADA